MGPAAYSCAASYRGLRPRIFCLSASRNAHAAFFIQIAVESNGIEYVSHCSFDPPAPEDNDHGDFIDLNCGPHWNTKTMASSICQEAASWTCELGDGHHAQHFGNPKSFNTFRNFRSCVASNPPAGLDYFCLWASNE